MNKQLEELAQPVAYAVVSGRYYNDKAFINKTSAERSRTERNDGSSIAPLYSQEYVSALQQRIAELEQCPTIKHMRSVEESLIIASDRAEAAEAKLATPVRLPQRKAACASGYGEGYLVDSDGGDCFDRDDVIEALCEQGFKVEGEA